MKTDVTRRAGTHCPCCHDRVHPTDLECRHCGADLAAGSHPSAKSKPLAGAHDDDETPHGFWPAMTLALVLMTVAFFVFPPAAVVMLAAAGAYQVARMHIREAT